MRSEAEELFERFCADRGLRLMRIPETAERTPDYELQLEHVIVAVEVKELKPSEEHLRMMQDLCSGWAVAGYGGGGESAGKKIRRAMKQLRPYAKKRMPALLVLYDRIAFYTLRLEADAIRSALYGPERIHVAVPRDPNLEPVVLGASYGGGRAVDRTHNTTLSAVATLNRPSFRGDPYTLTVFHNIHAALPLELDALRGPDIQHYTLSADRPEHLPRWRDA